MIDHDDEYQQYCNFIEYIKKHPSNGKIKHHIQPRAFGGGDEKDNIILLDSWQHTQAHYYLVRSLPLHSKERQKMIVAFRGCVSALTKSLYRKN
jgi:chromosomal replication initiation ATPase DnaA